MTFVIINNFFIALIKVNGRFGTRGIVDMMMEKKIKSTLKLHRIFFQTFVIVENKNSSVSAPHSEPGQLVNISIHY